MTACIPLACCTYIIDSWLKVSLAYILRISSVMMCSLLFWTLLALSISSAQMSEAFCSIVYRSAHILVLLPLDHADSSLIWVSPWVRLGGKSRLWMLGFEFKKITLSDRNT